ncbi:MAG: AI-2E family transporter [Xanthomonadaceae bacterium]|nr:AI-2E family transporter [Xanthomonadaceae bacterium]
MNAAPSSSGETFYARTFALVSLFLLGLLTYRILLPVYAALAWAAFIAFLLHPLHVRLTRLLRGRRNVSAGLLTLLTVLVILGPITGLAATFAVQAEDLLRLAQRFTSEQLGSEQAAKASGLQALLEWLQSRFGITPDQIQKWTTDGARGALGMAATVGGKVFVGALGTALGFTISMFTVFFLVRDGADMINTARGLIPMPRADKRNLFEHLSAVVNAVIYGTGVTALVQGALLGIGFAIIGLPAPVVVGVLGAVLALLPVVGTPVLWGPAALILILQDRWGAAIFLLVWGLAVSTIDNILRPVLVSGRGARIGTLTVFIGIIGGASAFGAVGLFLGPVVLSMVMALVRFALERRQPQAGRSAAATDHDAD